MILLELALASTLLLSLGAICSGVLRHASAASRHAVWTTVLAAILLLPAARLVTPGWQVISLPQRFTMTPAAPVATAATLTDPVRPMTEAATPGAPAGWMSRLDPVRALSAIWLAGALLRLLWIGVGAWGTRRLERRARPLDDERICTRAGIVAAWLGVRRPIRLLAVSHDAMPVTWGVRTPRVLLPDVASAWTDDRLDAVLTHELSHVVRKDALSHLVARVATAVWWWHPLAWSAARAARLDRERACDDLVLTTGTRASDYAADLVTFVTSLQPPVADSPALLAMARRSQLEGRVMAILENGVNRKGVSQAGILAAMLVLVLVLPLAAARTATTPPAQEPVLINDARPDAAQDPVRVGGQVKEPKKIKDVRPVYPASAQADGRQGIAIIEAQIGVDGTITSAKTIRSIGDDLDAAALDAVTQWRFTPTLLNGVPVPVIMTVSVTFRLDSDGQVIPPPPPPPPPAGTVGSRVGAVPAPPDAPPPTWSPGDPPLRIGGAIKEPTKIKDVKPVYPPIAQAARVSGIVILEINVDQDGKVVDARVIRPVALLDQAAIDAVLQWEYMPTLLNGQPVPVLMTVTVVFTLEDGR
jgi:TonB family protein